MNTAQLAQLTRPELKSIIKQAVKDDDAATLLAVATVFFDHKERDFLQVSGLAWEALGTIAGQRGEAAWEASFEIARPVKQSAPVSRNYSRPFEKLTIAKLKLVVEKACRSKDVSKMLELERELELRGGSEALAISATIWMM